MNKVEKIKAEIERQKEIHFKDYHINKNGNSADYGACNALTQLLSFIDSLEEEPVSNDLEEFAKRESELFGEREYEIDFIDRNALAKGYYWGIKAGAQWQKEQMIDKVCKWLAKHWREYVWLTDNDIIHFGHWEHDFKKSMEE